MVFHDLFTPNGVETLPGLGGEDVFLAAFLGLVPELDHALVHEGGPGPGSLMLGEAGINEVLGIYPGILIMFQVGRTLPAHAIETGLDEDHRRIQFIGGEDEGL